MEWNGDYPYSFVGHASIGDPSFVLCARHASERAGAPSHTAGARSAADTTRPHRAQPATGEASAHAAKEYIATRSRTEQAATARAKPATGEASAHAAKEYIATRSRAEQAATARAKPATGEASAHAAKEYVATRSRAKQAATARAKPATGEAGAHAAQQRGAPRARATTERRSSAGSLVSRGHVGRGFCAPMAPASPARKLHSPPPGRLAT
jgi:hypothetical protein